MRVSLLSSSASITVVVPTLHFDIPGFGLVLPLFKTLCANLIN